MKVNFNQMYKELTHIRRLRVRQLNIHKCVVVFRYLSINFTYKNKSKYAHV